MRFFKKNYMALIAANLNTIVAAVIIIKSFSIEEISAIGIIVSLIISNVVLLLLNKADERLDKFKVKTIYVVGILLTILLEILIGMTLFYLEVIGTYEIMINQICLILSMIYLVLTYKVLIVDGGEVLININILLITLLIVEKVNQSFELIFILSSNLLFILFISNFERIKNKYSINYNNSMNQGKLMIRCISFILITILIATILPKGNESILSTIKNNREKNNLGNNEEVIIKDSINLSSNELYRVSGLPYPNEIYYFKRRVFNYFTGNSWKKQGEETLEEIGSKKVSNNFLVSSGNKSELAIEPIDNYDNKYLTVDYPISISSNYKVLYNRETGEAVSNKSVKNSYTIYYYDNIILKSLIADKDTKAIEYDFKDKYLQLPDNVNKDIKELVYKITDSCKSDYDKVRKIKEYLITNYKYTLSPEPRKENEDFMSYFMLRNKSGYCVYFATAMTIMCRIAGIPARYVEGYYISNEYNSETVIKESDGHAWVEVMYNVNFGDEDNFIWMLYDPTPPSDLRKINDNTNKDVKSASQSNSIENVNNKLNKETSTEAKETGDGKSHTFFILVIIVSIRALYLYMKRRYIVTANNIKFYKYVLKRLRTINIKKLDNEGHIQFVNRINDDNLRFHMKIIVDVIYRECFSKDKEIYLNKNEEYKYIENYIKEKQGFVLYWLKIIF